MKQEWRLQSKETKAGFVTFTPVAHLVFPSLGTGSCKSFPQALFSASCRGGEQLRFGLLAPLDPGAGGGPAGVQPRMESAVPGAG